MAYEHNCRNPLFIKGLILPILAPYEYAYIQDVVAILYSSREEKEEREAIARAKAQVKKGKTISLANVKKKYDLS